MNSIGAMEKTMQHISNTQSKLEQGGYLKEDLIEEYKELSNTFAEIHERIE